MKTDPCPSRYWSTLAWPWSALPCAEDTSPGVILLGWGWPTGLPTEGVQFADAHPVSTGVPPSGGAATSFSWINKDSDAICLAALVRSADEIREA